MAASRDESYEELARFARLVRHPPSGAGSLDGFFDAARDLTIGRAPGRLDVMGGIADYSGSLVLELPIREGAFAAAQSADDGVVRIASVSSRGNPVPRVLAIPVSELSRGHAVARSYFSQTVGAAWGAYVAGVLVALVERGSSLHGARLLVSSSVPEGKGVSSSAAVSVASLTAASNELGAPLGGMELAFECQKVENLVAGAPSGVMDQTTTALGERGKLLELLCQPALVRGAIDVPAGIEFFGIDSGIRHAVSGSDYGLVRVAAFMGYRIVAEREGFRCERDGEHVVVHDSLYGGYLANVPEEVLTRHRDALPERLAGADFLELYGGTTDRVTRVDPRGSYPVRAATFHAVLEHARVQRFAEMLPHATDDFALELLGELMAASHASYSACGLGSQGTDLLVELALARGAAEGLFGAKITGGGSGGTVVVLAAAGAGAAIEHVAAEYRRRTWRAGTILSGSSPGALEFGVYRLRAGTNELVRL